MASETKADRTIGFGPLCCPKCGEQDAVIAVDLDGMSDFRCDHCEERFERSDVEKLIARVAIWGHVLAWLDTAPERVEGD